MSRSKTPCPDIQLSNVCVCDCVLQQLLVSKAELKALCDYYFDGKGKALRPMIVVLMARACNVHSNRDG